jgi:hypothetical protein
VRHKHADVIHAWAEGAKIQYRAQGSTGTWNDVSNPGWAPSLEYRVKPSFEIITYRDYITEDGRIGGVFKGEPPPDDVSMWLGDWVEVKVEL